MVESALLYARISKEDGEFDKVASQLSRLREAAKKAGYEVDESNVFSDNDVSAWQEEALEKREGFKALLLAVQQRRGTIVMATESARIARRNEVEAHFMSQAVKNGFKKVVFLNGQTVDLTNPQSIAMAGFGGVMNEMESAIKSMRVKARFAEKTAEGKPKGGFPRPFGFKKDHMTPKTAEKKMLVEAYKTILDRKGSQAGIARAWNEAGQLTTRGKPWTSTAVRQLLERPSNIGKLVVNGVEQPKSLIKPLVDEDLFNRYMALVGGRPQKRGRPTSSLLSGLLTCFCGEGMIATSGNKGVRVYRCRTANRPGTGAPTKAGLHGTVVAHVADLHAREGLYSVLKHAEVVAATDSPVAALEASLSALRGKQKEWTKYLFMDGVDVQEVQRNLNDLKAEVEALEAEHARAIASDISAPLRNAKALVMKDWFEDEEEGIVEYDDDTHAIPAFVKEFSNLSLESQQAIFAGVADLRLLPVDPIHKGKSLRVYVSPKS